MTLLVFKNNFIVLARIFDNIYGMAADLIDNIINQSFLDDLAKYNSKPLNNSENKSVDRLFNKIGGLKDDCNICYDNCKCIQCYQCEFKYCQKCLGKITSEFTKCSACQIDFKNSLCKIEEFNIALIKKHNKKTQPPPPIPPRPGNYKPGNSKNSKAGYVNSYLDNYLADYQDNYEDGFGDGFYDDYTNPSLDMFMSDKNKNLQSSSKNGNGRGNDDLDLDDYELEQLAIIMENHKITGSSSKSASKSSSKVSSKSSIKSSVVGSISHEIMPTFIMTFNNATNEDIYQAKYTHSLPDIKYNIKLVNLDFQQDFQIHLLQITNDAKRFNLKWIKIENIINLYCVKMNMKYNIGEISDIGRSNAQQAKFKKDIENKLGKILKKIQDVVSD